MQRSRAGVWLVAAVAAAASLPEARDAHACTPPWGGVTTRTVWPGDGAIAVPRNARIQVAYDGNPADNALALRVQGGDLVATSLIPPRLIVPDEVLAASTTYEVLDTLSLPCEHEDVTPCLGAATVIATFTTGTGLDVTPPAMADPVVELGWGCLVESCPEGQSEAVERITIVGLTDEAPAWVRYEYLSTEGELLAGPTHGLVGGRGCDGLGYIQFIPHLELPTEYQIRAVDIAGNVEVSAHTILGGTCAEVEVHCGVEVDAGSVDAEPSPDATGNAVDDPATDGCGCASSRGAPGTAVVAIVALLLASRRRRTRRR